MPEPPMQDEYNESVPFEQTAPFTGNLSVSDLILLNEAGFQPLELVLGACYYDMQGRYPPDRSRTEDLTDETQRLYTGRGLALERLENQATRLGADGIIGLTVEIKTGRYHSMTAEIIATGTAIVHCDSPLSFRNKQNRPFTTDLSGQDFYNLLRCGYKPLGMVIGCCIYFMPWQDIYRVEYESFNSELTFTQEFLKSQRTIAMDKMRQEADALGADGIMGIGIRSGNYLFGEYCREFFALGTAVEIIQGQEDKPPILVAIPLDGSMPELTIGKPPWPKI
jgi:uncharacterized protein YbjQ (UPF0145 family)